jgi:predicted ATPase
MVGHRMMGTALASTGDFADALPHYDQTLALYHPAEHRPLAARFGHDNRVAVLGWRALASWVLGYPEKAVSDIDHALKDAREIGQAATLMFALNLTSFTPIFCGDYATANALVDELVVLADGKGAFFWKAYGMWGKGSLLALTGKAADAVQMITSGITAWRSTGATMWLPLVLSYLTRAYAELGQFDDAWRSISDAMTAVETTKERLWEAEVNRLAGEIALRSPEPDVVKVEAYFERALTVARQQQAKSWELRAAMSMARLWRDQGRRGLAYDLLAPVYGWFTEGFDTLDLTRLKRPHQRPDRAVRFRPDEADGQVREYITRSDCRCGGPDRGAAGTQDRRRSGRCIPPNRCKPITRSGSWRTSSRRFTSAMSLRISRST